MNDMNNINYVPDWKLERYLLGELPAAESSSIAALESSDCELRKRIAALRSDNADILERCPPEQAAKRIVNLYNAAAATAVKRRASPVNKMSMMMGGFVEKLLPSRKSTVVRAAVAFAAVLLAVVGPVVLSNVARNAEIAEYEDRIRGTVSAENPEALVAMLPDINAEWDAEYEDRTKGTPSAAIPAAVIEVWRKEGAAARQLTSGDVASEGDIIQLRYEVPQQCYGVIASIDGRGVATIHLSDKGNAAALSPGNTVALKYSYELDNAPHYEIFYLITAPEIFDIDEVKRLLTGVKHPVKDAGDILIPQGRSVTIFTLKKSLVVGMK